MNTIGLVPLTGVAAGIGVVLVMLPIPVDHT